MLSNTWVSVAKTLGSRMESGISPGSEGAERAGKFEVHQKILSLVNTILSGRFSGVPKPLDWEIHIFLAKKC